MRERTESQLELAITLGSAVVAVVAVTQEQRCPKRATLADLLVAVVVLAVLALAVLVPLIKETMGATRLLLDCTVGAAVVVLAQWEAPPYHSLVEAPVVLGAVVPLRVAQSQEAAVVVAVVAPAAHRQREALVVVVLVLPARLPVLLGQPTQVAVVVQAVGPLLPALAVLALLLSGSLSNDIHSLVRFTANG